MTDFGDLEVAAQALEILTEDGMGAEDAFEIVSACIRSDRDPIMFAWHLVELRKAWRTILDRPHGRWAS